MKYIIGDILTPNPLEDHLVIVCHQVNCKGVMGAGLARQIREKHPDVFSLYRDKCLQIAAGIGGLGDVQFCSVIADAGYGAYFGHGYGHCIGMECHEPPNCNPSGTEIMKPNMVSSAEPGIYLPGKFGVRIEDVVIFTADGCENITKSPKKLIIV